MNEFELRELCHRFFDALEARDVDAIAEMYAQDMTFWINVNGTEKPREQSLEATRAGYGVHRRRTYNDRRIDTFPGGFIARYTLNIVRHSGEKSAYWACLVAHCQDGKFVRIEEYIDSGKFPKPPAGPASLNRDKKKGPKVNSNGD